MSNYPFLKLTLRYFFYLLAPFLSVSSQINCFEALTDISKTYQIIGNNQLIDHNGKSHSPYLFHDSFHSDLVFKLKDTNLGFRVYKAYDDFLRPLINNAQDLEVIQNAIMDTALLFGGPRELSEGSFLKAIRKRATNKTNLGVFSPESIGLFLDEISGIYTLEVHQKPTRPRIVIITTSCSGGNLSIAKALLEELCNRKDIDVIMVDTEEIAQKSDPILAVTGKYTYEAIYSCIFQQTNDYKVISERKQMRKELHPFVPSNVLYDLKTSIAALKPDIIISTRSYTEEDLCLSTLGKPFCMMNVDFELSDCLDFYYKNAPESFIQFWIQHINPSMFKPLFTSNGFQDLYHLDDTCIDFYKKLAFLLEVPVDSLNQKFKVIGYPCSSVFFPISDESHLALLRKKWAIKEGNIPVFILMGKHGTKATKKIFSRLVNEPLNQNITYLFISGNNAQLKLDLEQKVEESKKDVKNNFQILGCLTPEEMNEILNICPTGISKSGASSTIEFLTLNKSVLLMSSYPWEEVNGRYLIEKGLAQHIDYNGLIADQINHAIENSYVSQKTTQEQNWRFNLEQEVNAIISSN